MRPPTEPANPPAPSPPRHRRRRSLPLVLGVMSLVLGLVLTTAILAYQAGRTSVLLTWATPFTPATPSTAVPSATPVVTSARTPTAVPTRPTPTGAPGNWTTVQTFSGYGSKQTPLFQVPGAWKIVWACDPRSYAGGKYSFQVSVYGPDQTPLDLLAIQTTCKAGNTGNETEEHTAGTVSLEVTSEAAWTLKVQIPK